MTSCRKFANDCFLFLAEAIWVRGSCMMPVFSAAIKIEQASLFHPSMVTLWQDPSIFKIGYDLKRYSVCCC